MTFADFQPGDAVFVDANVLIYHFTNHPRYGAACTTLVERMELQEIQGFTSSLCLADVAHRIMALEAMSRFTWPASGLAARLKKHHASIPQLSLYQAAAAKVGQVGIQVLPVSEPLVLAVTHVSQQCELLTGDALIVALMRQHGLTKLASEDADFDRVPGITRSPRCNSRADRTPGDALAGGDPCLAADPRRPLYWCRYYSPSVRAVQPALAEPQSTLQERRARTLPSARGIAIATAPVMSSA